MRQKYEEYISLILRTRNLRRPSRMFARNWKHQWLLLCLARSAGTIRIVGMVVNPVRPNQNLRVFWKLMNLQDCVWENLYRIIMKTILQEKVTIHSLQHYNLVHKFILMPQAMKIPAAKAAADKEWEKLEKISAWNLTKVRSKKEVIDEARTKGAKVHFVSLMDICHLKNAELETKHQKYKGRVVLRGDIVKDDSGSYAVFTEQGSSASQMTAAKVMDIISQTARLCRTSSWRSICWNPGKNGRCSKITENSQIGMSRHLDSSATDTNGLNHGPVWKIQSFFLRGICTVILWQDYYGKGKLRKSYWSMAGRKFQIGNVSLFIVTKDYSYLCMWMT